jgi:hypothetical protein
MTTPATSAGGPGAPTRPLAPARRPVALACTLSRPAGSPIAARTIDLGPTGMRLMTERPLAVDETLAFDLPGGELLISGHARVICQERPDVYVLRFSSLVEPAAEHLQQVVCGLEAAS